jgi:hypothetical protein
VSLPIDNRQLPLNFRLNNFYDFAAGKHFQNFNNSLAALFPGHEMNVASGTHILLPDKINACADNSLDAVQAFAVPTANEHLSYGCI